MSLRNLVCLAVAMLATAASTSNASMFITEWMYSGVSASEAGEFIEFTNLGNSAVDMTGWYYSDDARNPGGVDDEGEPESLDLSPFGVVAPGESVIVAEAVAGLFRAEWSLPMSVKVIGGNTVNLGRNDEINLYNASLELVDRLTYGDSNFAPGTIRTQNISGNPKVAALGTNNVSQWLHSFVGDRHGSVESFTVVEDDPGVFISDVANPGTYAVPEPASVLMFAIGIAVVAFGGRTQRV